jgi:hypothetical protein
VRLAAPGSAMALEANSNRFSFTGCHVIIRFIAWELVHQSDIALVGRTSLFSSSRLFGALF